LVVSGLLIEIHLSHPSSLISHLYPYPSSLIEKSTVELRRSPKWE
jgi:hypothetical protein